MNSSNNSTKNSITTQYLEDKNQMIIHIHGSFNASLQRAFRDAYEYSNFPIKSYLIDFSEVSEIDSTGLGTLVAFKDYTGNNKSEIILANIYNDEVKETLELSNMHKILTVK